MKKRLFCILMAMLMFVSFAAACGGGDDENLNPGDEQGNQADEKEKWQPPDNFGGREFIIGDWFSAPFDAPKKKPDTVRKEMIEDYQYLLTEQYGFTYARGGISGWGDYLELFTTSVMAGEPAADVFVMSKGWAQQLMNQGLLYPLSTLDSVDVYADKWLGSVTAEFTGDDGEVYAITNEKQPEGRRFIYWNKRLFAEAGLDPDLPYDLQLSGEWTWDKFREICEKLTIDKDGDGVPDTFAFCGFAERVFQGAIYSNNAQEISVGPDGLLYNSMLEPNFIEAMQFLQSLWDDGLWYDGPEDKDPDYWNWFDEGFMTGVCAMLGADPYQSSDLLVMEDDWGMVMWPRGPKADDQRAVTDGNNVFVLPFNISKDKAEEIMYTFNLWTEPLQDDLDNPDWWKYDEWGYHRFKDSRAVDETMARFYEGRYTQNARTLAPGGEAGIDWGPVFDWGNMGNSELTPIEKIEAAKPIVDSVIARVNNKDG